MIGFGEFSNLRYMEIKSLSDERLMLINPTAQGFYDKVLQFKTEDKDINAFIRAVYEVQEAELTPFWRPGSIRDRWKNYISKKKATCNRTFL